MTDTQVSIPPRGGMDWDEYQEMVCLMLEGHNESEARRLARSANDKVNSKRLSGPTTGDTKNGHGDRPIVSDMSAHATSSFYQNAVSLTQDTRDQDDRLRTWFRQDMAEQCLELMTPRQREIVDAYMGISTGEPMTGTQVAEKFGITPGVVRKTVLKAAVRVRKQIGE